MMKTVLPILFFLVASTLFGQTLPDNFSRVQVGGTIDNPTVMAFAPDGRIFVAEQGGILRVIKNNQQLAAPFITLTVNSQGERGLIGITFDPDFNTNNHLYLYYTTSAGGLHNRISRFTANGDVVAAGSEQIILELDALSSATNHNGGALAFGQDGKLYVAIGENANGSYAQNLDIYHGKFLRINKDGSAPTDNPFNSGTVSEQRKRVWSYGLRNPYTIAVHPTSGRILLNDVGQNTWEEVNDATTGGKNFGWPGTEGVTTDPAYTSPIYAYKHTGAAPTGCAITGGAFLVSNANNYPTQYKNKYFFVDHCSNWMYYVDPNVSSPPAQQFGLNIGGGPVALTTGPDGNLYYLSRSAARLYKIVYTPPSTPPSISQHPQSLTVNVGQNASFSVTAAGTAPLTYQWQKNNVNISGATQATFTINNTQTTHAGNYRVVVTNPINNVTSNAAALTVTTVPPNNHPPVANVTLPLSTLLYKAGSKISFEGTATDEDEATLPASAFSWAINFHHDTHKHDQPAITGIKSGAFDVPNRGETSSNVWYRIILTVTDAIGLKAKDSVDIYPSKSDISFATTPPGLQILLDGQPITTPVKITSVEGLLRDIGIPQQQSTSEVDYTFTSWSQGGAATQTITTPENDITYTASFSIVTGVGDELNDAMVYPNPADDRLFIKSGIRNIKLTNSLGQSASLIEIEAGGFDVSEFPNGIYIVDYMANGIARKVRLMIR